MSADQTGFKGAKLAAVHDGALLVYRRDDRPDIPFPNLWDLPGGGREGDETAAACVLRELAEEFGLALPETRLTYARRYSHWRDPAETSHFFGLRLDPGEIAAIQFGSEGQHWQMMPVATFVGHGEAVPHLRDLVAEYWRSLGR